MTVQRSRPWYSREPGSEDMAKGILDHVLYLRRCDEAGVPGRRARLAAQRALYLDRQGPGMTGLGEREGRSAYPALTGATQSVHAKITTTRPRPNVIAVGGRWKHERSATLLQRWLDGFYEERHVYASLSDLCHDGMIYDTGWLKVLGYAGDVHVQRVWDGDILLDPHEERFPPMRTLFHVCAADRDMLIERYPDKRKQIEDAEAASPEVTAPFSDIGLGGAEFMDKVVLYEAYRLGPTKDKPGLFVATIPGCILEHRPYERSRFPFVSFKWGRDPERYRGQSFVEQGAGVQMDLDEHADVIREGYGFCVPRPLVPSDSKVQIKDLGDDMRGVVYEGGPENKPEMWSPDIAPGFVGHGEVLGNRVYRVVGASEMEATSMTSPNLDSGRAILAHQDATSIRFQPQGTAYEQAAVDLAVLILDVADELAKDKSTSIKVFGTEKGAELIDYRDVRMDKSDFTIRVFPASKLPDTVAGRQQILSQWVKDGILTDPLEYRRLMDMPDLERSNDLAAAKREYADMMIERCIDGKPNRPGTPDPRMDLPYAIEQAQLTYCRAMAKGGEEDDPAAMQRLRDFIGFAEHLAKGPELMAANGAPAPAGPAPVPTPPVPPDVGLPPTEPPIDPTQMMLPPAV